MSDAPNRTVAVICGGVGAARFLRGLLPDGVGPTADDDPAVHRRVSAIVNTGDDCSFHGLSISPDLDTVVYTLAGAIDAERGWGLTGETWRTMDSLDRYADVRPLGSSAAQRWFGLGDRDLATHFYRTARLAEGATLTEVTDEIRRAWSVPVTLLPMTDERRSTLVTLAETGDEVAFQEYFVRLRHDVPVRAVRFDGPARLTEPAQRALREATTVVIAPSNPLVSIGPIRSLDGVDEILAERRERVVAVSPIVGGEAIKGPAARMMDELGHEPSVVGVARLYAPIASVLVVDPADRALAPAVEEAGMRCVVTPSVMSTPERARTLAAATLAAVD